MQTAADWMTKNPHTIEVDSSLLDAIHFMKEKAIRRLPVLQKGKLVGIVTERMLREYTPSRATTLDAWELNYVLAKTSIKEVMNSKPQTVLPEMNITEAAQLLLDKKLYGVCVTDNAGKLIGILTTGDFLRAMVALAKPQR